MAALVLRPPHALDLGQLYAHVAEHLPPYAWPRFLRLQVTPLLRLSPHMRTPVRGSQTPHGSPRHTLCRESSSSPRDVAPALPCHLLP